MMLVLCGRRGKTTAAARPRCSRGRSGNWSAFSVPGTSVPIAGKHNFGILFSFLRGPCTRSFLPPEDSEIAHESRRATRDSRFLLCRMLAIRRTFSFLPISHPTGAPEKPLRGRSIFSPYSFFGIPVISNNNRKRYLLRLTHCVRRKRLVSRPPFVHHTSFRTQSCHFWIFGRTVGKRRKRQGSPQEI